MIRLLQTMNRQRRNMKRRQLKFEPLERRRVLTATISPLGVEFPVNATDAGYQEQAAVAVEDDGDFVVAWSSWGQDGSQGGVYAQQFDAAGAKQGDEILVNTTTEGNQGYPDVAIDPTTGSFVVVWQQDAAGTSDVYARAFDGNGAPVGDQTLLNAAAYDHYNPAIACVDEGAFVVAWDSFDPEAGSLLHARRFLATNTPEGDEFAPAAGTREMNADVAARGDGSFVIVWQSTDADGAGVAARMYGPDSAPVGLPLQVNDATAGDQTNPKAAVAPDGTFAISWLSTAAGSTELAAQRFSEAGLPQGSSLDVNADATVQAYDPSIAALRDGSFHIVWTDDDLDVLARTYDPDGAPINPPLPITTTAGGQLTPDAAAVDDRMVVAWTGEDSDGDGVFGQVYSVITQPPTADAGGPYEVPEGTALTLDASASTTPPETTIVSYAWDFDDDGQYDDATGVSPTFLQTDDGVYTIGLLVTNSVQSADSSQTSVTVSNAAPTADAGGPYSVPEGGAVLLTASASFDPGDDIVDYLWDFDGDGDYDDAVGVQPLFSAADLHAPATTTVGLKVVDDDGAVDTTTVEVVITPADPHGILVTPDTTLQTNESGVPADFTVVLTSRPTAEVRIPLAVDDASEGQVSTSELIFTPENWADPQPVSVAGLADGMPDPDVLFHVTMGPMTSDDVDYDGVEPDAVAVVNVNQDDGLYWDGEGDGEWTDPRWKGGPTPWTLPNETRNVGIENDRVVLPTRASAKSLVIDAGATLAVDSDVTLNVAKDLALGATIGLEISFSDLGAGTIAVGGEATVAGDLDVSPIGRFDDIGYHSPTILHADGGVSGQFTPIPQEGDYLGQGCFYRGARYRDADDNAAPDTVVVDFFQATPGDRDGDADFDFNDVFEAFAVAGRRYGTGEPADWTEGDWELDGDFDFKDVFHAFAESRHLYGIGRYADPPSDSQASAGAESDLDALAWRFGAEAKREGSDGDDAEKATAVDALLTTWP